VGVNPSFRTFVLEQLARLDSRVRARSMFGGVGIYSGELFFALIDEDTVYFKVDDSNRPDFVARGMRPFQPGGPGSETMQYYEVPPDLLEDVEALRSWVEKAVAVARRRRTAPSRRSRGARKGEEER
jgi:DNA transformation protein